MSTNRWLLLPCVLIGLVALTGGPRAQGPAAAFYAIGDLPGGGATTIIRDATESGGVIYAVGSAATILLGCGFPGIVPCAGPDTPILWRFDGVNPATLEALPGIDPGVTGFPGIGTGNGASDITPDGKYVASQARKAVTGGFAPRPVRVDTSLLPSSSANLDLNTTFSPALAIAATALATSSDGTIVYGNGPVGGVTRAIRFDTTGATSLLIPLLGTTDTQNNVAARGVSTDGTVVVGASIGGGVPHAYRYEHGPGVSAIPTLPGGTFNTPLAVSPDGDLVLVSGNSAANPNTEAYLYSASTNAIQPLGSPNAAFRTGGRLCANDICNPTIQIQGGMTADGSVVAMNFTTPPSSVESGYAYFHNANGWFHLTSVLGANGVDIAADGWQNLVITSMSSDGTLVFGAGDHNGVVEGFLARFGDGVLAAFNPQAAPPVSTALVGAWGICETGECDVNALEDDPAVVVFTADGAYYEIEKSGFERGYYTYDGSELTITTLLDTNGGHGASDANGRLLSPVIVDGDAIVSGGPLQAIRFPGSIAEPLVGAWVAGNPTLPDSSFVAVFLGSDRDNRYFVAIDDNPDSGGDSFEVGTFTWDPVTHQLDATPCITPVLCTTDVGNFATPAPDGLTLHLIDDEGPPHPEFDFIRVIDPATPAITSALAATATTGLQFAYQIAATNGPSTFGAVGFPAGLNIDTATGLISGIPTVTGTFDVLIEASNTLSTSTGRNHLSLVVIGPVVISQVGPVVVTPIPPPAPGEPPPVTIEFTNITSGGTISVATIDPATVLSAPEPPAGFSLGDNPVYYEITPSETLTFDGPVTVCFSYTSAMFAGLPTLLHYDDTLASWVDITIRPVGTSTICGLTSSFSPFAVAGSALAGVGFYPPVSSVAGTVNVVTRGSIVPLKFNVYTADGGEITDPARISNLSFGVASVTCAPDAPRNRRTLLTWRAFLRALRVHGWQHRRWLHGAWEGAHDGTSLRYDVRSHQFVQNWRTPTAPGCYFVSVTGDGLFLSAEFKVR